MKCIVGSLRVKEDKCDDFERMFAIMAARTHAEEDGCYLYQVSVLAGC